MSIAVAILLGPWAARWFLVAFWLLTAGVFCYMGLRLRHIEPATRSIDRPWRLTRQAVFALAIGFACLAAATAVRALAGGRVVLLWILYAVACIGMVAPFVLKRSARRDSPTDSGSSSVGTA